MRTATISIFIIYFGLLGQSAFSSTKTKASIASILQAKALRDHIYNIPSRDQKVTAIGLNIKLREMNLPQINVDSPNFEMTLTSVSGPGNSNNIGIEIVDGTHKYCLPCEETRNSFTWGIVGRKMNTPDKSGDYYHHLECLKDINVSRVRVSNQKISSTRFVAIPGVDENKKEGFFLFTDKKVFFYKAKHPTLDNNFPSYKITLPDGEKTAIELRVRYEPDRTKIIPEEIQTSEQLRNSVDDIDLKSGSGAKKGKLANEFIDQSILNQFKMVITNEDIDKNYITPEMVCKNIVKCESFKTSSGSKINLNKYWSKFNCKDTSAKAIRTTTGSG